MIRIIILFLLLTRIMAWQLVIVLLIILKLLHIDILNTILFRLELLLQWALLITAALHLFTIVYTMHTTSAHSHASANIMKSTTINYIDNLLFINLFPLFLNDIIVNLFIFDELKSL